MANMRIDLQHSRERMAFCSVSMEREGGREGRGRGEGGEREGRGRGEGGEREGRGRGEGGEREGRGERGWDIRLNIWAST